LSGRRAAVAAPLVDRSDSVLLGYQPTRPVVLVVLVLSFGCAGKSTGPADDRVAGGSADPVGGGGGNGEGGTSDVTGGADAGGRCVSDQDCGAVHCRLGRCAFAECNARRTDEPAYPETLRCMHAPPTCPPEHTPSLVGSCWGACVPVTSCDPLDDCGLCSQHGLACARYSVDRLGPKFWCFTPPTACAPLTCDCAAEVACRGFACQGLDALGFMNCAGDEPL
jgi:hypothetical protein